MPTTRSSHDLPIVDGIGFHKLTGSQRSRLVKSTRKLTKILGETPKLQVEQSSPKTTLPPQNGSWVKSAAIQKHPYSPISSITKKFARAAIEPLQIAHPEVNISKVTHSTSGPSSANASLYESSWSRVLLIEAKPKPSFESESEVEVDSRASYISQLSPRIHSPTTLSFGRRRSSLVSITTSKSALFSPTEWEKWMEEREAHSRRKRLSKLTRHLGESIPPDLVFPIAGSSELNKGSSQKGHLLPDFLPIVFPLVSSASEQGHPSPLPKPFISDSLQTAESGGYPPQPKSSEVAAAPRSFIRKHRRSYSESAYSLPREHLVLPDHDMYFGSGGDGDGGPKLRVIGVKGEANVSMTHLSRSESRLGLFRPHPAASFLDPHAVTHRSERRQGWSGEWNANIQDVISRLRDLR